MKLKEDEEEQKIGLRCKDCNHPFLGIILINAEINRSMKRLMQNKCPKCDGKNLAMGLSLTLSEDRAIRNNYPADSNEKFNENTLYNEWLNNGEVGSSAKSLGEYMLFNTPPKNHPHDYDDLRRCILLLDRIPQWKPRMTELKIFDKWEKIANDWISLENKILKSDPEAKHPISELELIKKLF